MTTVPVRSLAQIQGSWTDEQRRLVWYLICRARSRLRIEVNPVVATAFVILQRYFRSGFDCPFSLFTLMATALWTSCKQNDSFRPMALVWQELENVCANDPSLLVRSLCSESHAIEVGLTDDAKQLMTLCEFNLLRATNFDFDIDLPFNHFDAFKPRFLAEMPQEHVNSFCNRALIDICLFICSQYYLDVPPQVAAAAAMAESFATETMPPQTSQWVESIREEYGSSLFELAVQTIVHEKERTAIPRQKPNAPFRSHSAPLSK